MRCVTGSQCRVSRIGWMWSDFLALHTSLAAAKDGGTNEKTTSRITKGNTVHFERAEPKPLQIKVYIH